MKEFMLIYKGGDPEWMKNASKEEMAASMARWGAWMGALQEKDQLASGGSPLQFSGKRLNQDGVVTDISASEFKELVTGFSIVKANDMDEAISIAKECPIFNYPDIVVEVREVMNIECS
ncbi:MAG: YciI family protein [Methylococcaceae bacterium]